MVVLAPLAGGGRARFGAGWCGGDEAGDAQERDGHRRPDHRPLGPRPCRIRARQEAVDRGEDEEGDAQPVRGAPPPAREALATAAVLAGVDAGLRLITDARATGLLVDADRRVRHAPGLDAYLE